ncbi:MULTISPECIES: TraR/DksA family transcriptional regulator [unclassified Streptomyces]|uniref:TraR/DksA family transcriptional regulator n=1 Tax=unclassified Streptomyces TaxID=2593676 RepID=UPI00324638C2
MVAKKTAAKKTASAGSTGATAGETGGDAGTETALEAGAAEAAVKKTAAKKTVAKKAAVKKAPAKKSAAKKASKKAADAADGAAEAAGKTGAHTVVAKKSAARSRTAGTGAAPVPPARGGATTAPGELAVRPGEDPWTPEEVAEARAELTSETMRLRSELEAASAALAGLMRDSGDGAGDDEADTGTKNITREHEMSLAANAQEMLDQTERALARLDAGTYGLCEICGNPIGKARMQAFPRATLCVEDKQKQERRG